MPELTQKEATRRIEDVLRTFGIKLSTGSCGCCNGTYGEVEFPDGMKGDFDFFDLDTRDDGLSRPRG